MRKRLYVYIYMYKHTWARTFLGSLKPPRIWYRFQAGFKPVSSLLSNGKRGFKPGFKPVSSRFQALKPTLLRGSGFKPGFKPVLKTQTPKQRDLAARPARGKRGAPSLRKRFPTSGHKASVSPARFQAGFKPVSSRFQASHPQAWSSALFLCSHGAQPEEKVFVGGAGR